MSRIRGPLSTILSMAVMLVVLLAFFGCSDDDLSAPDNSFGTIEIKMPADKIGAEWHLYGPGDSFRHGDADVVLHDVPAGQYTIIWTAVKNWTGPTPTRHSLTGKSTLTLSGQYLDKAPGSNFARISTTDFIMGSEDGTRDQEVPSETVPGKMDTVKIAPEVGREPDEEIHRVVLDYGYQIGKTEITNQEFVELGNWAIAQGHATTTETSMLDALDGSRVELINFDFADTPIDVQDGTLRLKKPEDANRPVIEVTWYGAASYCDWLSLNEELPRAYDHDTWTVIAGSYRLPTEAEWENACRAGTKTAFSSGDAVNGGCEETALNSAGWYCGNAGSSSHDVGTKEANQLDISDMHGNVWEWCNDFYATYNVPDLPTYVDEFGEVQTHTVYDDEDLTPVLNPMGPAEGDNRVIRSGRWLLSSAMCRSAARMMTAPDYQGFHIGFRVGYKETPVQ